MADIKHKTKVYEQFFPPDLGRHLVSPFLLSDSTAAEVHETQIPMTAHRCADAVPSILPVSMKHVFSKDFAIQEQRSARTLALIKHVTMSLWIMALHDPSLSPSGTC